MALPTNDWKLTFLGTGNLNSHMSRGQSAVLLEAAGCNYLFDCGDGTADRLRKLGKSSIDLIAVSEPSTTAMAGILAVAELNRHHGRAPAVVVGPIGVADGLVDLANISRASFGELFQVDERAHGSALEHQRGIFLESVPVDVGTSSAANAYLMYETPVSGHIDARLGARLGLKGADFSLIQEGHTVRGVKPGDIMGPPQAGRRLTIASRGRQTQSLIDALQGSDVAILAAPFMDERLQVAEESFYLTGWEAARLFATSKVKFGLLTQLGPYAPPWIQLAEARQYFPSVGAPYDGQRVEIPLPARGRPTLTKVTQKRQTDPST
jgi:ribonuclease Z